MDKNFTVTFTPFEVNNAAQLTTTATVSLLDGEVLWEEPVIVNVYISMTKEDIDNAVNHAVSGFSRRVDSILLARSFQGLLPETR